MNAFYQKVVLITGAASGFGRELSHQLADQGAVVIATDLHEAGAEAVADAIRQRGGQADYYRLDVTNYHAVRTLIQYVANQYGRLDYVFCNAGTGLTGSVRDIRMEEWEHALNVNLNGIIYTATEAYKVMAGQGYGHVVTTAPPTDSTGSTGMVPYLATKHAVVAFARALRQEARTAGVRVSAFCPGCLDGTPTGGVSQQPAVRPVPVGEAVRQLLRGVADNQEVVVTPFYEKVRSWMAQFSGSLNQPGATRQVPVQSEMPV